MPLQTIDCSPPKKLIGAAEPERSSHSYVISTDGTVLPVLRCCESFLSSGWTNYKPSWGEVSQTPLFSIIFLPAKTAKSARNSHGDGRPEWKQTYSASLRLRWNTANASVGTTTSWTIFTCIHHHTHIWFKIFVGLNGSVLKVLCGSLWIDLHLGWLEYISIQSLIPRKAMHNWPLLMRLLRNLAIILSMPFPMFPKNRTPKPKYPQSRMLPRNWKNMHPKSLSCVLNCKKLTIVLHLQNHLKQKLITHTHFKHLRSLWSNNFAVWRFCFGRQVTQKQLNWTKSNVTTVAVATKALGRR